MTVQPPAPLSALEEVQSSDNSPLSSVDAYPVMKADPSPFSSRPVMFETEEVSRDHFTKTSVILNLGQGKKNKKQKKNKNKTKKKQNNNNN